MKQDWDFAALSGHWQISVFGDKVAEDPAVEDQRLDPLSIPSTGHCDTVPYSFGLCLSFPRRTGVGVSATRAGLQRACSPGSQDPCSSAVAASFPDLLHQSSQDHRDHSFPYCRHKSHPLVAHLRDLAPYSRLLEFPGSQHLQIHEKILHFGNANIIFRQRNFQGKKLGIL